MLENRPELLLVDDQPGNLTVLKEVIAEHIPLAEIETAGSAGEALARVAAGKFDGILTDVQMPGIDGLELCRRLKANVAAADVPFILITSHLSTPKRWQRSWINGWAARRLSDYSGRSENLEVCDQIWTRLKAHSRSYGSKRSSSLGQTAEFAAGSWIVRQPPRIVRSGDRNE